MASIVRSDWSEFLWCEVNGKIRGVNLDDWMYQINESLIMNRTIMTKWGFKVGEITLIIEKLD
ncbi:MAG: DUF3833 domain-containing protein [Gammaproteobacteria bacterium]|nr:DUF3833 domain-containing protein [Gammaproteobacteria bacterium]MCP4879244.1 DUF3833 domain-containing protein [Gammaproteobacteria bacterium]